MSWLFRKNGIIKKFIAIEIIIILLSTSFFPLATAGEYEDIFLIEEESPIFDISANQGTAIDEIKEGLLDVLHGIVSLERSPIEYPVFKEMVVEEITEESTINADNESLTEATTEEVTEETGEETTQETSEEATKEEEVSKEEIEVEDSVEPELPADTIKDMTPSPEELSAFGYSAVGAAHSDYYDVDINIYAPQRLIDDSGYITLPKNYAPEWLHSYLSTPANNISDKDLSMPFRAYLSINNGEPTWYAMDKEGSIKGFAINVPVTWNFADVDEKVVGSYIVSAEVGSSFEYVLPRNMAWGIVSIKDNDEGNKDDGSITENEENNSDNAEQAVAEGDDTNKDKEGEDVSTDDASSADATETQNENSETPDGVLDENNQGLENELLENENIAQIEQETEPQEIETFRVVYTDGLTSDLTEGNGTVFENQVHVGIALDAPTPKFEGEPIRDGYRFVGWEPSVREFVSDDITYNAVWEKEYTYTTRLSNGVSVSVIAAQSSLPANPKEIKLEVTRIKDDSAYDLVEKSTQDPLSDSNINDQDAGGKGSARLTQVYDIKLIHNGEEIEPLGDVSVIFGGLPQVGEDVQIFHLDVDAGTSEEMDVTGDASVGFVTNHFSAFAVTWTVDFSLGNFTFSIVGMDSVLLSEIFDSLGISKDVNDVEKVIFSDPELIDIEKINIDNSLTQDWKLTSLKSFDTEETLTVIFEDGEVISIKVTDPASPQDGLQLWDAIRNAPTDGTPYEVHLTTDILLEDGSFDYNLYLPIQIKEGQNIKIVGDGVSVRSEYVPMFAVAEGATLTLGEGVTYVGSLDPRGPATTAMPGREYSAAAFAMVYGTLNIEAGSGNNVITNFGRPTTYAANSPAKAPVIASGSAARINFISGTVSDNVFFGPYTSGGFIVQDGATMNMYHGATIDRCAGELGGGVQVGNAYAGSSNDTGSQKASLNFYGGTFSNCVGLEGGAIAGVAQSDIYMSGGTITECSAYDWTGKVQNLSYLMKQNPIGTTDWLTTGGPWAYDTEENLNQNVISEWSSRDKRGLGGGVYICGWGYDGQGAIEPTAQARLSSREQYKAAFNMVGGSIIGCKAAGGGGVYIGSDYVDLENGTINNNYASKMGGGVMIADRVKASFGSESNMVSVVIRNNHADANGGGLWFCPTGVFVGENSNGESGLVFCQNDANNLGDDLFKSNPGDTDLSWSPGPYDYVWGEGERGSYLLYFPWLVPDGQGTPYNWYDELRGKYLTPAEAKALLSLGRLSFALRSETPEACNLANATSNTMLVSNNSAGQVGGGIASNGVTEFNSPPGTAYPDDPENPTYPDNPNVPLPDDPVDPEDPIFVPGYDPADPEPKDPETEAPIRSLYKTAFFVRDGETEQFASPGTSAKASEVKNGDMLEYAITYNTNTYGDYVLTDTIPEGMTLVEDSITPSGEGTYDEATRTITWRGTSTEETNPKKFTFRVTVDEVGGSRVVRYLNQAFIEVNDPGSSGTGGGTPGTSRIPSNITYHFNDGPLAYFAVRKIFEPNYPESGEDLSAYGIYNGFSAKFHMIVREKDKEEPHIFAEGELPIGATQDTDPESERYGEITFTLSHAEVTIFDYIEEGWTVELWEENITDFKHYVKWEVSGEDGVTQWIREGGDSRTSRLAVGEEMSGEHPVFTVDDDKTVKFTNYTPTLIVTKYAEGSEGEKFNFSLYGNPNHFYSDRHHGFGSQNERPKIIGDNYSIAVDGSRIDFELADGESIVIMDAPISRIHDAAGDFGALTEFAPIGYMTYWDSSYSSGYPAWNGTSSGVGYGPSFTVYYDYGKPITKVDVHNVRGNQTGGTGVFFKRDERDRTSNLGGVVFKTTYTIQGTLPYTERHAGTTETAYFTVNELPAYVQGAVNISHTLARYALEEGQTLYLYEVPAGSRTWDDLTVVEPGGDSYLTMRLNESLPGRVEIKGHGYFEDKVKLVNGYYVVTNEREKTSVKISKECIGVDLENPDQVFDIYVRIHENIYDSANASGSDLVDVTTLEVSPEDQGKVEIPESIVDYQRTAFNLILHLKDGESVTLNNVPANSTLFVAEKDEDNWSSTMYAKNKDGSDTIGVNGITVSRAGAWKNDRQEIRFVNVVRSNKYITVIKKFLEQTTGTFFFEVKVGNAKNEAVYTPPLPAFAGAREISPGVFTFAINANNSFENRVNFPVPIGSHVSIREIGHEGYDVYNTLAARGINAGPSNEKIMASTEGEQVFGFDYDPEGPEDQEKRIIVGNYEDLTAYFLNVPKETAELSISKTVEGGENNLEFPFSFVAKDEEGNPAVIQDSDLAQAKIVGPNGETVSEGYSQIDSESSETPTTSIFSSEEGVYRFSLKNDQKLIIPCLPIGYTVNVAEEDSKGYKATNTVSVSGKVDASGNPVEPTYSESIEASATLTDDVEINYTNKITDSYSLKLFKEIVGGSTERFKFTLKPSYEDGSSWRPEDITSIKVYNLDGTEDPNAEVAAQASLAEGSDVVSDFEIEAELGHGQYVLINDIPKDVKVLIAEDDPGTYQVRYKIADGIRNAVVGTWESLAGEPYEILVEMDNDKTVLFRNIESVPVTGILKSGIGKIASGLLVGIVSAFVIVLYGLVTEIRKARRIAGGFSYNKLAKSARSPDDS